MSRFAYRLCIAVNLGIGLAVYAYGFLTIPGGSASPVPEAKPQKVATLKPAAPVARDPAAKPPQDTITGAINPSCDAVTEPVRPQAIRAQAAKIPGVRLAALGPQALPPPPRERWTPAVGYDPVLARLLVTEDAAPGRMVEVDLDTGAISVVATGLHSPQTMLFESDGSILVAEQGEDRILRLRPRGPNP